MVGVYRGLKNRISLVGVSVFGALASNWTQLLISRYLLFGPGAWLLAPPFLAVGTVTSVILGLFAQRFSDTSLWVKQRRLLNAEDGA